MLGSINSVLMAGLKGDDGWSLKDYVARGGYKQLSRILQTGMTQEDVISLPAFAVTFVGFRIDHIEINTGLDAQLGFFETVSNHFRTTDQDRTTAMPNARHWISPRYTGNTGLPSTKQETISVPPEIEASRMSCLISR